MTESKTRTRIRLKPIIFTVVGIVALAGILWLTGFFGDKLGIFAKNADISQSQGFRDHISQGTDVLITQADVPISGRPDVFLTDPKIGPIGAELRIVVFGSLTSGYTAGAYDVINAIRADYPDTVQVVWKDLFNQDDQTARDLAIAAHCANQQSKFWDFIGGVFNQSGGLPKVVIDDIAKNIGLNVETLHSCQLDAEVGKQIDSNLTEAGQLNVREVPVWFIGNRLVDGLFPYTWMKPIIDEQLP
jgi:protein-disulfide isomerase